MRARRSSIRLPARRLSLLAPRPAARPHLDPRSRSRRLVVVFGSGGTASRCLTGRRCDGVTRSPSGASAVRRGGPKAGRGLARLSGPSLKAGAACASPALRGRWGELLSAQISCAAPGGSIQGGTAASTSRSKTRFFARARGVRDPRGPRGPRTVLAGPASAAGPVATATLRAARVRPREGPY